MSRVIKIIIGAVVVMIVAAGIWYLISSKEKESAKEPERKIEVAVILPLTGPGSAEGNDFLDGLLLAKEQFNPQANFYIEDSQSQTALGVTAAKRLLDTKNIDVIVSFSSSLSVPISALADEYDVPLIATVVAQNEFTENSKNAFRFFAPAHKYATLAADFIKSQGYKNISTLTLHDEFGDSTKDEFKKAFQENIRHQESCELAERDFRTPLRKLSGSDVIFSVGYNIHWTNLFKQREELGEDFVFVSNQNMTSNMVKNEVGDLFTNAYAVVPLSSLSNNLTQEFLNDFSEKYNRPPDWVAPFGYDMVLIIDAIQKMGGKAIDALYSMEAQGLNGLISFDENRECNIPLTVVEVKDGLVTEIENNN